MDKNLTPLQAIRAHCKNRCAGSAREVKYCVIPECELYPFRFGKNPYRKASYSQEEIQRRREQGQTLVLMNTVANSESEENSE